MLIGARSIVVDEASWVDVVDSILVGVDTGVIGVEGDPAGLHLDGSAGRPVSFDDRRIKAGLIDYTTRRCFDVSVRRPPIPVGQCVPLTSPTVAREQGSWRKTGRGG